ncbi:MAG: DUF397 domain-containing protein [Streptosporangiaceae bacterium]|nr:DUF397 domain-containing protein [Streptosporangiaceae bacterium]
MTAERDPHSAVAWRKSRASADQGSCVEVATERSSVLVRDSRDKAGAIAVFTLPQWRDLLKRIRGGELEPEDFRQRRPL